MFKKATFLALLALVAPALLASSALAQEDGVLAVQGGELSISTPSLGSFGSLQLDGSTQHATAQLSSFTVNDARGSGEGWHVTAQAEQFREWDGGYVDGGAALETGSLEMSAPDVAPDRLTTSPGPVVESGPYTIDDGSVTIASAATDTGMGQYEFSATTLTLTLPPSVFARNYRTSVTISVTSGP